MKIVQTILLFSLFSVQLNAQLSFLSQKVESNMPGVAGLTVGDINKDNRTDIIGCAFKNNTVAWWQLDENTDSWSKYIIDNNCEGAQYLCPGDIDGDSFVDVIVTKANNSKDQIVWYKNDGNEQTSWLKTVVASDFSNAHGVTASDMDRDGDIDIIATSEAYNRVSWFENTSNGASWEEHIIAGGLGSTQTVCVADINGDGYNDVVAGSSAFNQVVWFENGRGSKNDWTRHVVDNDCYVAHWVHVGDINKDGKKDIIGVSTGYGRIYWYENGGDTWTRHDISGSFYGAMTAFAKDLDNDRDLDIIGTAAGAGQVAVWENKGKGNFDKRVIKTGFTGAWPIASADIDGDTDVDIVAGANALGHIYWFENNKVTAINSMSDDMYDFSIYPNPSIKSSKLTYDLQKMSKVSIELYDLNGRLISTIQDGFQEKGSYSFDIPKQNNSIIFCKLSVDNAVSTKKLIFLK